MESIAFLKDFFEEYYNIRAKYDDGIINENDTELIKLKARFENKEIRITGVFSEIEDESIWEVPTAILLLSYGNKEEFKIRGEISKEIREILGKSGFRCFIHVHDKNFIDSVKNYQFKDESIELEGTIQRVTVTASGVASVIEINPLSNFKIIDKVEIGENEVASVSSISSNDGCFIATAVYGTDTAIEVYKFYEIRDFYLCQKYWEESL